MFKANIDRKTAIGVRALIADVVHMVSSEAAMRNISVRIEPFARGACSATAFNFSNAS
jgi:hypothetical protein